MGNPFKVSKTKEGGGRVAGKVARSDAKSSEGWLIFGQWLLMYSWCSPETDDTVMFGLLGGQGTARKRPKLQGSPYETGYDTYAGANNRGPNRCWQILYEKVWSSEKKFPKSFKGWHCTFQPWATQIAVLLGGKVAGPAHLPGE